MRRRFVQINGQLVEYGRAGERNGPDIVPDIQPYTSMITGETITSRSRHREHLKTYGYEEVGNDSSLFEPREIPDCSPQSRKELIRRTIDAIPENELRKMIKRDVDRIKWNSRER